MTLDDHGPQIRQLRIASGLSLRDVAEAVGGVHPSLVHRIETGSVRFSRYSRDILSFLLDCAGKAQSATPDPAAFADELSDAVWGPASAGFAYADRAQAGTEESDHRADIVIPAQHEIEVYENSSGAVVLKMDAGGIYDDDQVVIIRPEHVDAVVAALLRVKAEVLG